MEIGYLNTPLTSSKHLATEDPHELYIEERGNPNGIPVLFVHGGPGGSIGKHYYEFFDPAKFRIIAFDQRGTGQSRPFLNRENNNILATMRDIEIIRLHFGIDRWIIFGGSYGSTVALTYAINHPDRVLHLVLRGIFLGRQSDIDWLFNGGAGQFYPIEFNRFKSFIPVEEHTDLVTAYYNRITGNDETTRHLASKHWADWENGLITIIPQFNESGYVTDGDLSTALLESSYFVEGVFDDDNYILNHIDRIKEIPMEIVHGRFDVDCRLEGAYLLSQAHPNNDFHIVELGSHSPYERPMKETLIKIMDQLKELY